MPFVKRLIEPTAISRVESNEVAQGGSQQQQQRPKVVDELQYTNNLTLSRLIEQMSSFSRHTSDIFRELSSEMSALASRTAAVSQRVKRLHDKAELLNSDSDTFVTVSGADRFESDLTVRSGLVRPDSMPAAVASLYKSCESPPDLYKLDPLRDDGRKSMKIYSDPEFFFDLWAKQMLEEAQKSLRPAAHSGGAGGHKGAPGGKHKRKKRQRPQQARPDYQHLGKGVEFIPAVTEASGAPPNGGVASTAGSNHHASNSQQPPHSGGPSYSSPPPPPPIAQNQPQVSPPPPPPPPPPAQPDGQNYLNLLLLLLVLM